MLAVGLSGCIPTRPYSPKIGFLRYANAVYAYVPLCEGEYISDARLYADPISDNDERDVWKASGARGAARGGVIIIGDQSQFSHTSIPLRSIPREFILELSTNQRNFGGGLSSSKIRETSVEPVDSPDLPLTTWEGTRTRGQLQKTAAC